MIKKGRIADQSRLLILKALGEEVKKRYKSNVRNNQQGYNLSLIENALTYYPDYVNFTNHYALETGDDKLDAIANYFEYGTGIYNTEHARGPIVPVRAEFMTWVNKNGKQMFAKEVKGVKPIFAMLKAIKSVDFDLKNIRRDIRERLSI